MKIGALLLLALVGCATDKSDFAKLPISQLAAEIEAGEKGDASAAYRVANHYAFGDYQPKRLDYWCRKSADLGELRGCACVDPKSAKIPDSCG
jgi:hypothetical protein